MNNTRNPKEEAGMKNTLKTIVNYVLIGVIGFLPIALVFQIVPKSCKP
jgi:hypothetical protein